MAEKRYYWMKLKLNFMVSDTVDYLMSLPCGANYVVLYQMLCLKAINTGGLLCRTLGKVVVPFDVPKIQRDCKWFSEETIREGLEIFEQLGLIEPALQSRYTCVTNSVTNSVTPMFQIANYDNLIGSECDSFERVKRHRSRKNAENAPKALHGNAECNADVTQSVTIEIENRDRYINNSTEGDIRTLERGQNPDDSSSSSDFLPIAKRILEAWNRTGLMKAKRFSLDSKRGRKMQTLVQEFGIETVMEGIGKAGKSEFLKSGAWKVTLDWFLTPDNFQKTLEGQYDERWERHDDDMGGTDGTGGAKAGGSAERGAGESYADYMARRDREAKRKYPGLKDALAQKAAENL